jgi:hypothetical protein
MEKKLLIEKIETKIEEYREAGDDDFYKGAVAGLLIAKSLINE